MKITDLATLEETVRETVRNYVAEHGLTATSFAKEVGIHPYQMCRFLKHGKGILFDTIQKIGEHVQRLEDENENESDGVSLKRHFSKK
jgi:predicted transcriptional regulator